MPCRESSPIALTEFCTSVAPRVDRPAPLYLGSQAKRRVLESILESDWPSRTAWPADLRRTVQLLKAYADADLRFVAASVVALGERLRVTRLYTLDRRNFGIVRAAHAKAFEILP